MFGQSTKAAGERFTDIKTEKDWGGSISDGEVGALNSNTSATTMQAAKYQKLGTPTNLLTPSDGQHLHPFVAGNATRRLY